jgi:hypothetical protein
LLATSLRGHVCDLDGTLGFGALDAEYPNGKAETALLLGGRRFVSDAVFSWRKLRRLIFGLILLREPDPFGDMIVALKRGQLGPVQVLRDLPHASPTDFRAGAKVR